MKPKFIDYYMNIADLTAKLSYAVRLKVGSVIVKDSKVLATGYNGMPSGWENICEVDEKTYDERDTHNSNDWELDNTTKLYTRLKTKPEVLHSEMNSLMKVAKSTESSEGATLFCTHAPCLDCAKAIYQAGISNVYYREQYRSNAGLNFLKQSDVHVHQYSNSIPS